jgi:hypothetical protein
MSRQLPKGVLKRQQSGRQNSPNAAKSSCLRGLNDPI